MLLDIEDMEVTRSFPVDELARADPVALSCSVTTPLPVVLSPIQSFGDVTPPIESIMETEDAPVLLDVPAPTTSTAPPLLDNGMIPYVGPAPIEILFSFDTTGSMSSCLEEVQNNLKNIINRLLADIPSLKIAMIAHGDYCDAEHFYVLKSLDFTNDVNTLFDFVTNCGGTGGGDYEECYELVLRTAHEQDKINWSGGTVKSVVMIGDALPHPVGHGGNTAGLDWRVETDAIRSQLGAHIYAVQCLTQSNKEATPFWEELATRTHGKHLQMDQLDSIVELMMAICYREGGHPDMFMAYEKEIRTREGHGIHKDLDRMFNALRHDTPAGPSRINLAKGAARGTTKARKPTPFPTHKNIYKKGPVRTSLHCSKKSPTKRTQQKKRVVKVVNPKYIQRQQNRENVISQHFALASLNWSPWKVYSGTSCKPFLLNHNRPAVYEVAVQPNKRSKNYAVMVMATEGITSKAWDSYLLRNDIFKLQLSSALEQGCNIMVRRAFLPKVFKYDDVRYRSARRVAALLRKRYNYAWMRSSRGGQIGREISRNGKLISRELEYLE